MNSTSHGERPLLVCPRGAPLPPEVCPLPSTLTYPITIPARVSGLPHSVVIRDFRAEERERRRARKEFHAAIVANPKAPAGTSFRLSDGTIATLAVPAWVALRMARRPKSTTGRASTKRSTRRTARAAKGRTAKRAADGAGGGTEPTAPRPTAEAFAAIVRRLADLEREVAALRDDRADRDSDADDTDAGPFAEAMDYGAAADLMEKAPRLRLRAAITRQNLWGRLQRPRPVDPLYALRVGGLHNRGGVLDGAKVRALIAESILREQRARATYTLRPSRNVAHRQGTGFSTLAHDAPSRG